MHSQKSLFRLPASEHYLNCAYFAPMSRSVEQAGQAALERLRNPASIGADMFFEPVDEVRKLFARIIGADDHRQVAILPSVSYGMATVANNIYGSEGQEIVLLEDQFPSDVYIWRRVAQEKRLKLKTVKRPTSTTKLGPAWTQEIVESISPRTAVVCVPNVHWADGLRFDLSPIADAARASGAMLVIDGSQSVGALPIDVGELKPDALICAGYKWLMGPYGMSLGYFGPRLLEGQPLEENWITRRNSENFADLVNYRDEYQPGAIRFDVGERSNFLHIPMMLAALEQTALWGPASTQSYCSALSRPAVDEIVDAGYLMADAESRCGHIWGVRMPKGLSGDRVRHELDARAVRVSFRSDAIRVSPNVYNDPDDLMALVDALRVARDVN
ncbi:MAG: aminotransferase class V-fold PLP-dependent enzyme [Rhodothermia bacterium]|nr:aminotransferase class V-fold PLP-dependent enzyme [Rhodothermia bacterium]